MTLGEHFFDGLIFLAACALLGVAFLLVAIVSALLKRSLSTRVATALAAINLGLIALLFSYVNNATYGDPFVHVLYLATLPWLIVCPSIYAGVMLWIHHKHS